MRRKQKRKRKLRPGTFLFLLFALMLLTGVVYAGNQFRREVGEMAEYRSKIVAVKVVNDSIMEVMEENPGLHLIDLSLIHIWNTWFSRIFWHRVKPLISGSITSKTAKSSCSFSTQQRASEAL